MVFYALLDRTVEKWQEHNCAIFRHTNREAIGAAIAMVIEENCHSNMYCCMIIHP